ALAERKRFIAAALHLPHEENPEPDDEDEWGPRHESGEPRTLRGMLALDRDVPGAEHVDQFRIGPRQNCLKCHTVRQFAFDIRIADRDFFHASRLFLNLLEE